jgi:hypothetical protein
MGKIVCVPIYNKRFEYPIDLTKIYENNSCGLSNQLTQIINLISQGSTDFYADVFSTDLYKGHITPMSDILDLDLMNSKYSMNIKDVIEMPAEDAWGVSEINWTSPFRVYSNNHDLFRESARKMEISKGFKRIGLSLAEDKKLLSKEVNLIHLRIDEDFKIHCRAESDPYYDSIVSKYEKEIYEKCDPGIPLCLLIDTYEHELVSKLRKDYDVVYVTKEECNEYLPERFKGMRDIYAFCDFAFSTNLNINNLMILENSRETSSLSIILKSYLDYNNCTSI